MSNRFFRFIAGKVVSKCSCQVILSAGALGSPHLLLKNGIGAQKSLQDAGVQCIHDLSGVGENLQDHLQLRPGTLYMKDMQETSDTVSGYLVQSSNTQHTSPRLFQGVDTNILFFKESFLKWIMKHMFCNEVFWKSSEMLRPKFRVRAATLNSQVGGLVSYAVRGGVAWLGAALSPTAWRCGAEFLWRRTGPVSMAASQVCAFVHSSQTDNLERNLAKKISDLFLGARFEWRTDWGHFFMRNLGNNESVFDWVSVSGFFSVGSLHWLSINCWIDELTNWSFQRNFFLRQASSRSTVPLPTHEHNWNAGSIFG